MVNKLTQFGLASSFLLGLYDDEFTFKQLAEHGNFGHGTFNAIDGEMIAIDGIFYRADVNGAISIVEACQQTPIATMTYFNPDRVLTIPHIDNMADFQNQLTKQFCKKNRIYAIRVDASFECLLARSESAQTKPYESIQTSMPKLQHSFSLEHTKGSLVGYYVPRVYQSIIISGFHFHYITEARTQGGHVFDFKCNNATISIQSCMELEVMLPLSPLFDDMNLDEGIEEALHVAEYGHSRL